MCPLEYFCECTILDRSSLNMSELIFIGLCRLFHLSDAITFFYYGISECQLSLTPTCHDIEGCTSRDRENDPLRLKYNQTVHSSEVSDCSAVVPIMETDSL